MRNKASIRLRVVRAVLVATTLISSISGLGLSSTTAQAASPCAGAKIFLGRAAYCGYYSDTYENTGLNVLPSNPVGFPPQFDAIPNSMGSSAVGACDRKDNNDLGKFEFFIEGANGLGSGNIQRVIGARFIIQTMMGDAAGTPFPSGAALTTLLVAWHDRLDYVLTNGCINWNYAAPFDCGTVNTYYQPGAKDVAAFLENPAAGDGCAPGATVASIRFLNPGGKSDYVIKRSCANPLGSPQALAVRPTTFTNTITLSPSAPKVLAGSAVFLEIFITTKGDAVSPTFTITGNNNPAPLFTETGAAPLPVVHNVAAHSYTWTWPAPPTPGGNGAGKITGPFRYNLFVPTTTPSGTYGFTATILPSSESNAGPTTANASIIVENPKIPLLNVAAGNIYAGCGTASLGNVVTNIGASGAEVVTASGTINGLYSAVNKPSASFNSYTQTVTNSPTQQCRPDLAATAQSYRANGGAFVQIYNGAAYNLGGGGFNSDGIYLLTAANVTITGTVSHNITLYALGNVTVNGSVIISAAPVTNRNLLPGLGVITPGSVTFNASAVDAIDVVDGYFYAGNTINTCLSLVVGPNDKCNSILQVNGFLMGKHVSLQRWGLKNAIQDTITENVAIDGQLFLNPPMLFTTDAGANTQANGRGELSPRY